MKGRPESVAPQRKPRILHAPANVTGIAGLVSRAQRDLGFSSTSVEYFKRHYDFGVDRSLGLRAGDGRVKKAALMGMFALGAFRRYDVFHLYFGNTLLPHPYPDLPVLRALGKRMLKFDFKGYNNDTHKWVKIGEGSENWPEVLKALDEVGYKGWATAEVPLPTREEIKDVSQRMDRVLQLA